MGKSATKEDQLNFVRNFYAAALHIATVLPVPMSVILTQGAAESTYGLRAPGYNFFGTTAGSNWKGKRQLLVTTEYHTSRNVDYPYIISVNWSNEYNKWKYSVKRYFRAYDSAFEGFYDYAKNVGTNTRYQAAWNYTGDPVTYIKKIAAAGYATDPNYLKLLLSVHSKIESLMDELQIFNFSTISV